MRAEWVDRWKGGTVICIGSGPSLTEEDCDRARRAGVPTIVTNTTFQRCPWADVLFGFDVGWWRQYRTEVDAVFKGRKVTCSPSARQFGCEVLAAVPWFTSFHNSGANAVSLAITAGAARVLLLGFDCQRTGGQTHWHGDHPKALSNARSIANWPAHFRNVARLARARGTEIINCSRATALDCFPRRAIEEVV
jgi:hypothetical protein